MDGRQMQATWQNNVNRDDLRALYGALAGQHSTIGGARFAVAGLYMAALAFLASALPGNPDKALVPGAGIAILGLFLTVALWLLEIRNVCLLDNLDEIGRSIESKFQTDNTVGLFTLMRDQPIGPKMPFFRWCLPYQGIAGKRVRYVFSHSTGLSLVYLFGFVFWCCVLWWLMMSGKTQGLRMDLVCACSCLDIGCSW